MVNENNNLIIENKKPFETVQEVNAEIPTYEEFMKGYENNGKVNYADLNGGSIGEVEGYGPCKNSLCGCACSSYTCNCKNVSIRTGDTGTGISASGRARGGNLSGQADYHLFSRKDSEGEGRFLSSSVGGEVGKDGFKVQAGVDLANVKSGGVQARVGVNVDSGISTSNDTFEAKALGFGFSVGNQTGISTPFGEVKVDTEDCVIQ